MHDILLVAIVALVTAFLRFLPFLIFGENRTTPPLIAYLGKVLPFAIISSPRCSSNRWAARS